MQNSKLLFLASSYFCTCFKIGNSKYMPGTLGSIVGLVLGIVIKLFFSIKIYITLVFLLIIIAVLAINYYQKKMGKYDRSEIIIDEIIGQQIPLILFDITYINIFLSFIFFRFFDILKIFPASYVDKNYCNSLGIIFDDIIAGFQASLIIFLIAWMHIK